MRTTQAQKDQLIVNLEMFKMIANINRQTMDAPTIAATDRAIAQWQVFIDSLVITG